MPEIFLTLAVFQFASAEISLRLLHSLNIELMSVTPETSHDDKTEISCRDSQPENISFMLTTLPTPKVTIALRFFKSLYLPSRTVLPNKSSLTYRISSLFFTSSQLVKLVPSFRTIRTLKSPNSKMLSVVEFKCSNSFRYTLTITILL